MGECSSCSQLEDTEDSVVEKSSTAIRTVRATIDFHGTLFFDFKVGDSIIILHEDKVKQMAYGRVERNGKEGYFPYKCIQPTNEQVDANPDHKHNMETQNEHKTLSTVKSLKPSESDAPVIPKHIFFTKTSLEVVAGYSRNIHPTITNRLPEEIITLIWKFCIEPELMNTIKFGIITDKAEHVFDNMHLNYSRNIVSMSGVLKLTVLKDLIIDNNSEIRCDFGLLIINVYGNIYVKNQSLIVAEGDGNIYIKTLGSVVLESESEIKTQNITGNKLNNNKMQHSLHGNVYMLIEKDFSMSKGAKLHSGDIKIVCGDTVSLDDSCMMIALRNNINVEAKVGLNVDCKKMNDKLIAKNDKIFVLNSEVK
eukprot:333915_1